MPRGVEVQCGHCGKRTLIDPGSFGGAVMCAQCGKRFQADHRSIVPGGAPAAPNEDGDRYGVVERRRREALPPGAPIPAVGGPMPGEEVVWTCPNCDTQVEQTSDMCPFCSATRGGRHGTFIGVDPEREAWRKRKGVKRWGYTGTYRAFAMALCAFWAVAALMWIIMALRPMVPFFGQRGFPFASLGALACIIAAIMARRAINGDCSFWAALFGGIGAHLLGASIASGFYIIRYLAHRDMKSAGIAALVMLISLWVGWFMAYSPFKD